MIEIDSSELSAYLDGEQSAERRRAVAAELAAHPALQVAFDTLADADAAWRRSAQSAAFTPVVRLPRESTAHISAPVAAGLAVVLVVLKLVPEFVDGMALAVALHTVAFAVVLAGVAWLAASPSRSATGLPR
jgi:anti-sigma factor RsiW